ncbi:MAG TPA: MFS transporter [Solirubrobacterales bacterium]|jgi:EmrB/QacA subfamily drug resistance transporter|nr:MFS transporter [Solirubrobacterales bacterium]
MPQESRAKGAGGGAGSPWLVVAIVCVAQAMVVLDATIVNVALPSIQGGLHFSQSSLQWVINMYTLIFGGFMLLGGRAGDLLGRRRVFAAGIVLFSGASLLNGVAQSSEMLIVGRGLQGLGGALLTPAVLSLITTTFADGFDRAKALAIWSAIAAGGGAMGLLLGGVLTDLASWRWIFFVNVPVGVALVFATARFVPEARAQSADRSLDLRGAACVTSGLVVLVFGIIKSNDYGWGSGRTIALLAAGVVLLVGFVVLESRSKAPLVRLGIFRTPGLAAADLTLFLNAAAVFATFFFVSLYVQQILGYSPLGAGAAFLPFSAGIATGATVARKLVPKIGVHLVPVIGIALAIVGMLVLTQIPVDGRYVTDLLPGLLPLGLGLGLTFVPITLAGTSEVRPEDSGLASGLLNTAQQVGGSIGLAVLSTLAANRTSSLLKGASAAASASARVSGFHVAFIAGAVLLGAALVVAALQLRTRPARGGEPAAVPREVAAGAAGCAQCAPVAVTGRNAPAASAPADPGRFAGIR